jgi:hypothetical protein
LPGGPPVDKDERAGRHVRREEMRATAVRSIEDLFLTVQPSRKGVPEIGIGNVIGSLVFSVTGKLGIVVLAGGTVATGPNILHWHLPLLVGMTALAAYFLSTGRLKRLARVRAARALCRLLDRQHRRLRRPTRPTFDRASR